MEPSTLCQVTRESVCGQTLSRNFLGPLRRYRNSPPVWGKRYLALDGARASFCPEKLPLGMIYLFAPRADTADAPRVEELRPREALLELVQNTYMNWLLDRRQRGVEFDMLSRLVGQVLVRRIVPISDAAKLEELCSLIEQDAARALADKSATFPIQRP
jgi:hypothetical protein